MRERVRCKEIRRQFIREKGGIQDLLSFFAERLGEESGRRRDFLPSVSPSALASASCSAYACRSECAAPRRTD